MTQTKSTLTKPPICLNNPDHLSFNGGTKIQFEIPRRSFVKIEVFNILGEKITTLVNEDLSAGVKSITWNGKNDFGTDVASGIYLYRIQVNDYTEIKKMMLLK